MISVKSPILYLSANVVIRFVKRAQPQLNVQNDFYFSSKFETDHKQEKGEKQHCRNGSKDLVAGKITI